MIGGITRNFASFWESECTEMKVPEGKRLEICLKTWFKTSILSMKGFLFMGRKRAQLNTHFKAKKLVADVFKINPKTKQRYNMIQPNRLVWGPSARRFVRASQEQLIAMDPSRTGVALRSGDSLEQRQRSTPMT